VSPEENVEVEPVNLPAVVAHAPEQHSVTSMTSGPNPDEAVTYAADLARALTPLIKEASSTIQGKKHVNIEGWQTLAAATGHTCEIEWTRVADIELFPPKGKVYAWEARAIVRDEHGNVVAAAESMADPNEGAPWGRQNFACRGMASTRAMSRALASRMRYVVKLAGFEGTPAEEMPAAAQAEAVDPKKLAADRYRMAGELPADKAQLKAALAGNSAAVLAEDEQLIAFIWRLASIASVDADTAQADGDEEPLEGEITDEGNDDTTTKGD
jgi:hypothetical protein